MESYRNLYPFLMRLQIYSDIEDAFKFQKGLFEYEVLPFASNDKRYQFKVENLASIEPLYSARQVILEKLDGKEACARVALQYARLARESLNYNAATSAARRAEFLHPNAAPEAQIEIAKLLRLRGRNQDALKVIERQIKIVTSHSDSNSRRETLRMEMHLLLGDWYDESMSYSPEIILDHYKQAQKLASKVSSDEASFKLGRFYDYLYSATDADNENKDQVTPGATVERSPLRGNAKNRYEYVSLVIQCYTNALSKGNSNVHEALSRVLTLWFDFDWENEEQLGQEVQKKMQDAVNILPTHFWMLVMAQLLSRLLHKSPNVQDLLVKILEKVLLKFPREAFWFVVPVTKGQQKESAALAQEIIHRATGHSRPVKKLLKSGTALMNELIGICLHKVDEKVKKVLRVRDFRKLNNMFPTDVVIPTLKNLTPSLSRSVDSSPFAETCVTFERVFDEIVIMKSLMKPKKLTFLGSDGKEYPFLFKREDGDMRKDTRLIDFVTVVNRLLSKDASANARKLSLRTYAVHPITDVCGILEWVSDLIPLRGAVASLQKRNHVNESREIQIEHQRSVNNLAFLNWAKARYPPVLHKFFQQKFRDPAAWLQARTLFARSTAAWCMVGYVVGLGDRHGENIMLNTHTGQCVHVDFACLFEKGKSLKIPEVVPFRLTPNIVDAMGVTGYEGSFRCAAEIVMRILRENRSGLMSVLETFLHDPLVEWMLEKRTGRKDIGSARDHAVKARRLIEDKLRGIVGHGFPLSTEGQVERLIGDATSDENLSKMYVWWMSWI